MDGDEHILAGHCDVMGRHADERSRCEASGAKIDAQECTASVIRYPECTCAGGEVVWFLPDADARSNASRLRIDDGEAARVPVTEPDAAELRVEADIVRRVAEDGFVKQPARRGGADLNRARAVDRHPEPVPARVDGQVVRRPRRSYRTDDAPTGN